MSLENDLSNTALIQLAGEEVLKKSQKSNII